MEKIKDIIYEVSDIILAIIIIVAVSSIIYWKVSDTLTFSLNEITGVQVSNHNSSDTDNNLVYSDLEEPNTDDTNIDNQNTDNTNTDDTNTHDTNTNDIGTNNNNTLNNSQSQNTTEVKNINFTIPKGSTGISIANILVEKGLIENNNDFVDRVEERKLGSKLRAGDFTVKNISTLDEIIDIITGQ